ncbi:MAG: HepT-like ribonuclease domain-containing protein, partial [Thermomicrobiales bacterium]
ILQALIQIALYLPRTRIKFDQQQMVQDAILMRLQEIGENLVRIRQIDEEWFVERGDESWDKFIGLRNIISHGYHLIDADQIWQIVTEELPKFEIHIRDLTLEFE